jgi:hypothetical protein
MSLIFLNNLKERYCRISNYNSKLSANAREMAYKNLKDKTPYLLNIVNCYEKVE